MKKEAGRANEEGEEKASPLKVLGLSCGRRNSNSEILLKEACLGAEELGAVTEIIRLHDLNLKPCTGCENCTRNMPSGGEAQCVIKDDDMAFVQEKVWWEDNALILSAPIYYLTAPGLLKVVHDRFIPYLLHGPERSAERARIGASLSVGSGGPKWTPMGLPFLNMFLLFSQRIVVDQLQANGSGQPGAVVLYEDVLVRARRLGRNVAEAMKMPERQVTFVGEASPVSCPQCHSNLIQVTSKLPAVVCPICDIKGTIADEEGKMVVSWDQESVEFPRWSAAVMTEHLEVINKHNARADEEKERIKAGIEKYRNL